MVRLKTVLVLVPVFGQEVGDWHDEGARMDELERSNHLEAIHVRL